MRKNLTKKSVQTFKRLKELKVYQLRHANQFIIHANGCVCFQSYDSLIAIYDYETQTLLLGRDFDYSITTLRHLYMFINDYCSYEIASIINNANNSKQALLKAIKQGVILYDYEMK